MNLPTTSRGVSLVWETTKTKTTQIKPQDWADHCLRMEGLVGYLKSAFNQSTQHHVEALTGISERTVRNWLDGCSKPSGEHLARLVSVFGPTFIQAAFTAELPWVLKAVEIEENETIDAEIQRLQELRRKRE